ncbi:hypothetical protein Mal4_17870 [Maioricimonas rarisocia]|uniref:Uncharacterized protein n=1 Tax=Maioricimonas rarisocia TaxID=2528026 RepID=A0A517Z4S5_9PLAN|nr:hypothetical protein [Maioricimonas rarisocia]QDU37473.1 hypothetical protein Mal4_17870 [Maioricimonas rarisocia]
MSGRRFGVTLLLLFAMNVVVLWSLREGPDVGPIRPAAAAEPETAQQREEDFIQRVAAMSLEELEESLAGPELTVTFAGQSGSANEYPNRIIQVLADRRVARIFAAYLDLAPAEADRRAERLFDTWLAEHDRRLEKTIARYRVSGGIELTIGAHHSNHAVAAAAFLVSRYCPPSTLIEKVERWQELGSAATAKVANNPLPVNPLEYDAGPDSLVILNLSLLMLQQYLAAAEFEAIVRDQIRLPWPALAEIPLRTWATPSHMFGGVRAKGVEPRPEPPVLARYRMVRGWSQIGANTAEARNGVIRRAVAAVRELEDAE